ncbi:MAG: adenylosuccinate lyase [Candidatus Omnitrophota bacterium]
MIERYTRKEMGRIWSDQFRFETWLQVEIAACVAQNKLGVVPDEALKEIREKAAFDIDRIHEIEKTVDHETIAFLTSVAEFVGPASRYIHYGMTSSDKLDTALALQLVASADLLIAGLKKLQASVGELAKKHKHTVMMGRTHGIHAEPITFGLKVGIWCAELGRHIERMQRAKDSIRVGKLSGAVGTFSHVDPQAEALVCAELGLEADPISNQIIQRDRHAEYLSVIAIAGATLEKMATEIRGLQKTEIHEVEEPFPPGQKGSSSMPHKKNPNLSERICGLARLLRSYAVTGFENVTLWHERDISHSSVERITLADSSILLDYMLERMDWIIRDLKVYPERMKKNMECSHGLVFSQRVLLALTAKGFSREEAYRIVQTAALKVWESDIGLLDELKNDEEVRSKLSAEELEACFQLDDFLKNVDFIFERLGL